MLITLLLAAVKAAVGRLIGSSALTADALHSGTDTVALAASWFGLMLASREPTERFPYGFYRPDAVICRQIGEIAFHALRDDYVEVYQCPACTAGEALDMFAQGELQLLLKPTHSSEQKLEAEHDPQGPSAP